MECISYTLQFCSTTISTSELCSTEALYSIILPHRVKTFNSGKNSLSAILLLYSWPRSLGTEIGIQMVYFYYFFYFRGSSKKENVFLHQEVFFFYSQSSAPLHHS